MLNQVINISICLSVAMSLAGLYITAMILLRDEQVTYPNSDNKIHYGMGANSATGLSHVREGADEAIRSRIASWHNLMIWTLNIILYNKGMHKGWIFIICLMDTWISIPREEGKPTWSVQTFRDMFKAKFFAWFLISMVAIMLEDEHTHKHELLFLLSIYPVWLTFQYPKMDMS